MTSSRRHAACVLLAVLALVLAGLAAQLFSPQPSALPDAGRASLGRAVAPQTSQAAGRASAGRAAFVLPSVVQPMATQGHNAYAKKFGTLNWRAYCPNSHSSTGGSWTGPKHWTKAGADLDASKHFFGYND